MNPVEGKVRVNGKGAERVELVFHALGEHSVKTPNPHATSAADGSFRLGTYVADDGAPAGDYAVTATWPKIRVEGGEEIQGEDRFERRYADPTKPLAKVTVNSRSNTLPPFEIPVR